MVDDGNPTANARRLSGANVLEQDFVSLLPEHLLVTFLLKLPTVEAIRTCALSPRWRTLWTLLPNLTFDDREANALHLRFADLVDGALSGSHHPIVHLYIFISDAANLEVPRLAAWALAAAPRATGRFMVSVSTKDDGERNVLDLPCFPRASEILLGLKWTTEVRLPVPGAGAFACLTFLDLYRLCFSDGGASLGELASSRCTRLQILRLTNVKGVSELNLHAEQLLNLYLFLVLDLQRLQVVAQNLRQLEVPYCYIRSDAIVDGAAAGTEASVVAPMLEEVTWEGYCPQEMRFEEANGRLGVLAVSEVKSKAALLNRHTNYARILEHFGETDLLKLHISMPEDVIGHKELMAKMQLPHHLKLELCIARNGHALVQPWHLCSRGAVV